MARSIPTDLIRIFKASYLPVLPDRLIQKYVAYKRCSESLYVMDKEIPLNGKKVYLVGAGKAVQYMAREIEGLLGNKIEKGIVSIPTGSLAHDTSSNKISYYEGAKNNLPDAEAEITAKLIKELATSLTPNDVLLVLITGGGSALLPLPIAPITLDEKTILIKTLANAGADINELNIVRKRISDIKGGKLAMCTKAKIVTLMISDIVKNPFDLIASGPTVENKDDPKMALSVMKKYELLDKVSISIKQVLERSEVKVEFPAVQNFGNEISVERLLKEDDAVDILGLKIQKANEVYNFFPEDDARNGDSALERVKSCEDRLKSSIISAVAVNEQEEENAKALLDLQVQVMKDKLNAVNSCVTDNNRPSAKVLNFLLGSNVASVQAAYDEIVELKEYVPIVISQSVTGNVEVIAKEYVKLAKLFGKYLKGELMFDQLQNVIRNETFISGVHTDCRFLDNLLKPSYKDKSICLILAGETTVQVRGSGKGGRNQHLALEISKVLHEYKCGGDLDNLNVFILSAGTDGIDGPTDAAGAIGYRDLFSDCHRFGIPVNKWLDHNDSYTFYETFKNGLYHVKTGHTNTNVMDIHLIVITTDSFVFKKHGMNVTTADDGLVTCSNACFPFQLG